MKKLAIYVFLMLCVYSGYSQRTFSPIKTFKGTQWCGVSNEQDEMILSFITDEKFILEYVNSDKVSEYGNYLWNEQLQKGIATINEESYTITRENCFDIITIVSNRRLIFSLIKYDTTSICGTLWLGAEDNELVEIKLDDSYTYSLRSIPETYDYDIKANSYTWDCAKKQGFIASDKQYKIGLSESGYFFEVYVPQYDGSIIAYPYIRLE